MNQIPSESFSNKVIRCRACLGNKFKPWFDLGIQPLANNLAGETTSSEAEPTFPLAYMYCVNCKLVQTTHVVNPKLLFDNYLYYSSTSQVFVNHFRGLAEKEFNLDRIKKEDLVVDIGSNDGILLKPFKELGAKVVGVEPAKDIANKAAADGIETLPAYFNNEIALQILNQFGEAKLVTMTNAFAHVDDLDQIIDSVKMILADDGKFMVEVAYLPRMIESGTFDLLYHEHLSAWHIYPMQVLFARKGMYIDEVEFIDTHGGSIRVYAKMGKPENLKHKAKDWDLTDSKEFVRFPVKVNANRAEIMKLLLKLKKGGKMIVGYGAPAKMSTITNFLGIGPEIISYIIDDSPVKQGKYSPGKHIKIVRPSDFVSQMPAQYIFIFAWNFAEAILYMLKKNGYEGKCIIPFPRVKIV